MKKILITGGNGFIARSLAEVFSPIYDVTSLNKAELNLLDSLKVKKHLNENNYDVVIHTATYDAAPSFSKKDPNKVLEMNLKMFFNLANCSDNFEKMIYFGSGAEFGRENWIPKMDEDYFGKHIPSDQYGFSKYIMAKYAQLSKNIYNLRLFGLFGKYDDWRYRFIPNACSHAVLGKSIIVKNNNIFDFLYIDDLIKIVKWVIEEKPKHHIYNTCSGSEFEFKSLAKLILKLSNKKLDIIVEDEENTKIYTGNNSLLLNEFSTIKFTPIETSIAEMLDWYSNNLRIFDNNG